MPAYDSERYSPAAAVATVGVRNLATISSWRSRGKGARGQAWQFAISINFDS